MSVLDEYYWLNKHDPNYSLCRATVNCGEDAHTDKSLDWTRHLRWRCLSFYHAGERTGGEEDFRGTSGFLLGHQLLAVLADHVCLPALVRALEMKRYLCRYVHHIDGLPDFSALRFTKYNQYESLILPLVKYLENHGVKIEYGMDVKMW